MPRKLVLVEERRGLVYREEDGQGLERYVVSPSYSPFPSCEREKCIVDRFNWLTLLVYVSFRSCHVIRFLTFLPFLFFFFFNNFYKYVRLHVRCYSRYHHDRALIVVFIDVAFCINFELKTS